MNDVKPPIRMGEIWTDPEAKRLYGMWGMLIEDAQRAVATEIARLGLTGEEADAMLRRNHETLIQPMLDEQTRIAGTYRLPLLVVEKTHGPA